MTGKSLMEQQKLLNFFQNCKENAPLTLSLLKSLIKNFLLEREPSDKEVLICATIVVSHELDVLHPFEKLIVLPSLENSSPENTLQLQKTILKGEKTKCLPLKNLDPEIYLKLLKFRDNLKKELSTQTPEKILLTFPSINSLFSQIIQITNKNKKNKLLALKKQHVVLLLNSIARYESQIKTHLQKMSDLLPPDPDTKKLFLTLDFLSSARKELLTLLNEIPSTTNFNSLEKKSHEKNLRSTFQKVKKIFKHYCSFLNS